MPKFLETRLKSEAATKGLTGKKADAYTYGTMNKIGAMHGNKETPKGAAMQVKHDAGPKKKKKFPASVAAKIGGNLMKAPAY